MEFDVFLSYSSKDKPAADAACHTLEAAGVRCWMAPRDIIPGMDWGEAIVDAIAGAKLMVLMFSGNANDSPQIRREVELGVSKGIAIIPVRIENVLPTKSLEYFLSTPHWLDAFTAPLDQHLQRLTGAVQALLGAERRASGAISPERPAPPRAQADDTMRPSASRASSGAVEAAQTPPESGGSAEPAALQGAELLASCRDEQVLSSLNDALRQRGYHWIAITNQNGAFGHSQADDFCTVQWTGPTYDMSFNYEVRRNNGRLEVKIIDCTRLL
jgi:hypothetical protein